MPNFRAYFVRVPVAGQGWKHWVYLPYLVCFAGILLLGVVSEETFKSLSFYLIAVPCFFLQYRRPTTVGWVATLLLWVSFCGILVYIDYDNSRVGVDSVNVWVLFATMAALTLPLLACRPRTG
jgi:hypothetical protein